MLCAWGGESTWGRNERSYLLRMQISLHLSKKNVPSKVLYQGIQAQNGNNQENRKAEPHRRGDLMGVWGRGHLRSRAEEN